MFQQGERIETTGNISMRTFQMAKYESKRLSPVPFVVDYSYKKDRRVLGVTLERSFANAEAARSWATENCRAQGSDCVINLAPSGGCLAVATFPGGFRVSTPMLSKSGAEGDALAKCAAASTKGCSIAKTLCAPGL